MGTPLLQKNSGTGLWYNSPMSTTAVEYESSILQRLVASDDTLTPEAASSILSLRFSSEDNERMHHLAKKARQGTLTDDERAETEGYERVGALLGMLKSKARLALRNAGQSEPS